MLLDTSKTQSLHLFIIKLLYPCSVSCWIRMRMKTLKFWLPKWGKITQVWKLTSNHRNVSAKNLSYCEVLNKTSLETTFQAFTELLQSWHVLQVTAFHPQDLLRTLFIILPYTPKINLQLVLKKKKKRWNKIQTIVHNYYKASENK